MVWLQKQPRCEIKGGSQEMAARMLMPIIRKIKGGDQEMAAMMLITK